MMTNKQGQRNRLQRMTSIVLVVAMALSMMMTSPQPALAQTTVGSDIYTGVGPYQVQTYSVGVTATYPQAPLGLLHVPAFPAGTTVVKAYIGYMVESETPDDQGKVAAHSNWGLPVNKVNSFNVTYASSPSATTAGASIGTITALTTVDIPSPYASQGYSDALLQYSDITSLVTARGAGTYNLGGTAWGAWTQSFLVLVLSNSVYPTTSVVLNDTFWSNTDNNAATATFDLPIANGYVAPAGATLTTHALATSFDYANPGSGPDYNTMNYTLLDQNSKAVGSGTFTNPTTGQTNEYMNVNSWNAVPLALPAQASSIQLTYNFTGNPAPLAGTGNYTEVAGFFISTVTVVPSAPVTVNYVDQSGDPLQSPTETDYPIGNTYTVTPPATLKGSDGTVYTYSTLKSGSDALTGKVATAGNNVTLVYTPTPATVTVTPVDASGKPIAGLSPTTSDYNVGQTYNVTPGPITGPDGTVYTPVSTTPITGTVAAGDNPVNVVYVATPATVTVNYVDAQGDPIADPAVTSQAVGSTYDVVPSPTLTGSDGTVYTYSTLLTTDPLTGKVAAGDNSVTLVYTPTPATVTVTPVDQAGDPIPGLEPTTDDYNVGQTYDVTPGPLTGPDGTVYTPVSTDPITGKVAPGDNPVDVPYAATPATVTAIPVDQNGDPIPGLESTTSDYNVGQTYNVTPGPITGPDGTVYTPVSTDPITGTVAPGDNPVNVVYVATPATVTVNYVDAQGSPIADPAVTSQAVGSTYDVVPSPTVTGSDGTVYTYSTLLTTDPLTGPVAAGDNSVTLVYTPTPATVTAIPVDQAGDPIPGLDSTTSDYNVGQTYDVTPGPLTGPDGTVYTPVSTDPITGKVAPGDNPVDVPYAATPATVTAIPVDQNGDPIPGLDPTTDDYNVGQTYDVTPEPLTGPDGTVYTPVSTDPITGTVAPGDNPVDVPYAATPATVTVTPVDQAGDPIPGLEPTTDDYNVGQTYDITPGPLTGPDGTVYTPVSTDPITGPVAPGDNPVSVPYAATPATVTAIPVDQNGDPIPGLDPTTDTYNVGQTYDVTPGPLTGPDGTIYTPVSTDPITGTVAPGDNPVKVVYVATPSTLTVNYVDAEGHPIADPTVTTPAVGSDYTVVPPQTLTGSDGTIYSNDPLATEGFLTGTISADGNTVTLVYAPTPVTVTTNYVDQNDDPIPGQDPTTVVMNAGQDYTTDALPVITGDNNVTYVLQGTADGSDLASGTLTDSDVNVTYAYAPKSLDVTTNFVGPDGEPIASAETTPSASGQDYTTTAPEKITGDDGVTYVLQGHDPASDPISGTLANADVNVTYTYAPESLNVTTNFVGPNGQPIASAETTPSASGQDYKTGAPATILGADGVTYVLQGLADNSDPEEGTLADSNVNVIYTYVPAPLNVTTNYVGPDGTPIADPNVVPSNSGAPYTTEPWPEITDNAITYVFNQIQPGSDDPFGTLTDSDVNVTYTYAPKSLDVTTNFVGPNGQPIASAETTPSASGQDYKTGAPATILGTDGITYVLQGPADTSDPEEGTLADGNVNVTYTYAPKGLAVTTNFVGPDGQPIASAETTPSASGQDYQTSAPATILGADGVTYVLQGRDPDSDPASGTLDDSNVNVIYTYVPAPLNVTTNYVGPDGQPIADPDVVPSNSGAPYTTEPLPEITDNAITYVYSQIQPGSNAPVGTLTDSDVNVTYAYVPKSLDVTTNFVGPDGQPIASAETTPSASGQDYRTGAPDKITGADGITYVLQGPADGSDPTSGTLANAAVNVTYAYAPESLNVTTNFVGPDGEPIASAETTPSASGQDYQTGAPATILGADGVTYVLQGRDPASDPASGTLANADVNVTYTYAPKGLNVTTNFVGPDGQPIASAETTPSASGQDYKTGAPATILGADGVTYVLQGLADNSDPEKGTLADSNVNVTYTYVPAPLNVTTNYVGPDGTPIADPDVVPSNSGAPYTTEPLPEITDNAITYVFSQIQPGSNAPVGTLTNSDINVTYAYVPKGLDVTTNFVGPNGQPIASAETTPSASGQDYETSAPDKITGTDGITYVLQGSADGSDPTSGTLANADVNVTYAYAPESLNITTNFVGPDGEPIASAETTPSASGQDYKTGAPATILGADGVTYVLQGLADNSDPEEGTLADSNVNVTYTYVPAPLNVTTNYVGPDGQPIADPDVVPSNSGAPYTTEPQPEITDNAITYVYSQIQPGSDAPFGTLTDSDVNVTYTYVPKSLDVTTNFVGPNGEPIASAETTPSASGQDYKTGAPEKITGDDGVTYVLQGHDPASDPETGTLANSNINVTYTYTPAPLDVVTHYIGPDGQPIVDPNTDASTSGQSYETTPPAEITGSDGITYVPTPGSAPTSGTLADCNVNVNYQYVPKPLTVATDYVGPNGQSLTNPNTDTLASGQSYETTPLAEITASDGVTYVPDPGSAPTSGTLTNTNVTVSYSYAPKPLTVATNFVGPNGQPVASAEATSSVSGQPYDTSAPATLTADNITYVLQPGLAASSDPASGKLASTNVSVTYAYAPAPLNVTTNFVGPNGQPILSADTTASASGQSYDTTAAAQVVGLDGITYLLQPGLGASSDPASGTLTDANVAVTYTYVPKPATVTIDYIDQNGNPISGQDPTTTGTYVGQSYGVTPPAVGSTIIVNGQTYAFTQVPASSDALSGTVDSDKTITYQYALLPAYTITYVMDNNGVETTMTALGVSGVGPIGSSVTPDVATLAANQPKGFALDPATAGPFTLSADASQNNFVVVYQNTPPTISATHDNIYIQKGLTLTSDQILQLAGVSVSDAEETIPLSQLKVDGSNAIKWSVANYPDSSGYTLTLSVRDSGGLSASYQLAVYVEPANAAIKPGAPANSYPASAIPKGMLVGTDAQGNPVLYVPKPAAPKPLPALAKLPKTGDDLTALVPASLAALLALALLALRRKRRLS